MVDAEKPEGYSKEIIPVVNFDSDLNRLMESLSNTVERKGRCRLELSDKQLEEMTPQVIRKVQEKMGVGGENLKSSKVTIGGGKADVRIVANATGGDVKVNFSLINSDKVDGVLETTNIVTDSQKRLWVNIQSRAEEELGGSKVNGHFNDFFSTQMEKTGVQLGSLSLTVTPEDKLRIDFVREGYQPPRGVDSETEAETEVSGAEKLWQEELAKLQNELEGLNKTYLDDAVMGDAWDAVSRTKEKMSLVKKKIEDIGDLGPEGYANEMAQQELAVKEGIISEVETEEEEPQPEISKPEKAVPIVLPTPPERPEEAQEPGEEKKELNPSDFRPDAKFIEAIKVKTQKGEEKVVVYWWDGKRQVKEEWTPDWDSRISVGWTDTENEKKAKGIRERSKKGYKKSRHIQEVKDDYSFKEIPKWVEPAVEPAQKLAIELLEGIRDKDYPGFRQEEKADVVSDYLEKLSHSRNNFQEARQEYRLADKRRREQTSIRKSVSALSLEAKQKKYERSLDIALYEYEKDLKNTNYHMERRLAQQNIGEDNPEYEQFKQLGLDAIELYGEGTKENNPSKAADYMDKYAGLISQRINIFQKFQGLEEDVAKEINQEVAVETPSEKVGGNQEDKKEEFVLTKPRKGAQDYKMLKVNYYQKPYTQEEPTKIETLLFWEVNGDTFVERVDEEGEKLEGTQTYKGPVKDKKELNEVVDWFYNRFRAAENTVPRKVEVEVGVEIGKSGDGKEGSETEMARPEVATKQTEAREPAEESSSQGEEYRDFLDNPPDVSKLDTTQRDEKMKLAGEIFEWLRQRRNEIESGGVKLDEEINVVEKDLQEEFGNPGGLGLGLTMYTLSKYDRMLQAGGGGKEDKEEEA